MDSNVGRKCKEGLYDFHWKAYADKPTVMRPDGTYMGVRMEGLVPKLCGNTTEEEQAHVAFQNCLDAFFDPFFEPLRDALLEGSSSCAFSTP